MLDTFAITRRARRGMLREWRLHALSVFSLAVAFVCLGAALLVVTNLRADRGALGPRRPRLRVPEGPATPDEVEALRSALAGARRHRRATSRPRRPVPSSARVSSGAKGELAALPVEAFPASIEVEVRPDMTDAELTDMVGKLRQLPSVDDVETYQAWTERLARLVRAASRRRRSSPAWCSRRCSRSSARRSVSRSSAGTEVEVLKLVGATDRFVKGAVPRRGHVQGALGAAALGLLAVLFFLVRGRLDAEFARSSASSHLPAVAGQRRDDSASARCSAPRPRWSSLRKLVAV